MDGGTLLAVAASVAGVVGAALTGWQVWLQWSAQHPRTDDVPRMAEQLAGALRTTWEQEAEIRQLHDPEPLTVRWSAADPTVVDHPDVVLPRTAGARRRRPPAAGTVGTVVRDFRRLPLRRLVVIGEPGAGKTAFLVLLLLGLLRDRGPGDPVPVLLSPSSWDPTAEPFRSWVRRRLEEERRFLRSHWGRRRSAADELLDRGLVLPLLDGLDEMPAAMRTAAIAAINRVGSGLPLVVACRDREYRRAVRDGDVLTGAWVVRLQAVEPGDAEAYLRRSTPPDHRQRRWEPVFARLGRDGEDPLAAALSTPLMLSLARTIYATGRADPAELARLPSRAAIEGHLLDRLVPAQLDADERGIAGRWDVQRVQAWLRELAARLHQRDARDLAWWELGWMPRSRIGAGLVAGLAPGILGGVTAGVFAGAGLMARFGVGFGREVGAGLDTGLDVGITAASLLTVTWALVAGCFGFLSRPASVAWRWRPALTRGVVRLALLIGAVIGIVNGLGWVLLVNDGSVIRLTLPGTVVTAIVLGAAVAVVVGAVVAGAGSIAAGMVGESDEAATPATTLGGDRNGVLLSALLSGIGLGILFGSSGGVALVCLIGLSSTLGAALRHRWSWYQAARFRLAVRGRLPWRLLTFLEDAYQLGILRRVGSVYQFRHARLQDRLAGVAATASRLWLDTDTLEVEPDGEGACTAWIENTGDVAAEYALDVTGAPAAWATVTPRTVELEPGGTGSVAVVFRPPRSPAVGPGPTRFGVRALSPTGVPTSELVEGVVEVGAYRAIEAALLPEVGRGWIRSLQRVRVRNAGNAVTQVRLAAADSEGVLRFRIRPDTVLLPPGAEARVRLGLRLPPRLVWGRLRRFEVHVQAESAPPLALAGSVRQHLVQIRSLASLSAALGLVLALVLAVTLLPPRVGPLARGILRVEIPGQVRVTPAGIGPSGGGATLQPWAYALVDRPAAAGCSGLGRRAGSLDAGATATVCHEGTGSYDVQFAGLAAPSGVAHVTAYGPGPEFCEVAGWSADDSDRSEHVDVRCFDVAGHPADAMFVATFTSATVLDPDTAYAYVRADQPGVFGYLPPQWNSTGKLSEINRLDVGYYEIRIGGVGADGGSVQVTAYGTRGERCQVAGWNSLGRDQEVDVYCFGLDGSPVDSQFVMTYALHRSMLGPDRGPSRLRAAYLWVDFPEKTKYPAADLNDFTSTGTSQPNTVTSPRTGVYLVAIPSFGPDAIVQVSAFAKTATAAFRYCKVASWTAAGADVRCFDPAGAPANSSFDIAVLAPP